MKASLSSVIALLACTLATDAADQKKTPTAKSGTTAASQEAAKTPAAATGVNDVTPEEAEKLIKERKDVTVLDVRTPEEFKEGHIAGAKNVDALDGEFEELLGGLDRNKSYLLHCAAGGRSARVLEEMKELGFKSIYHMPAGMRGWQDAGKPVQK